IPLEELFRYMRHVARFLDEINHKPRLFLDGQVTLQHRNISPMSLLLLTDAMKVSDMSAASVLVGSTMRIGVRPINSAYAAPETLAGTLTSWSDQFSLALTYVHLRTGSLPYAGGCATAKEQFDKHRSLALGSLPEG